eukprot:g2447.t1
MSPNRYLTKIFQTVGVINVYNVVMHTCIPPIMKQLVNEYQQKRGELLRIGLGLGMGGGVGVAESSGDAGLPFGEGGERVGHGVAAQVVQLGAQVRDQRLQRRDALGSVGHGRGSVRRGPTRATK